MMTKEECLETLEDSRFLEVVIRGENGDFEYYSNFEDTVTFGLLEKLINEHFELKKRYNLLKESYDELLENAIKLQEGICPICENRECKNKPLEFEVLEKALDKACELVAQHTGSCPNDTFDYYMNCDDICNSQTAECWKKYLLKEAETNENTK